MSTGTARFEEKREAILDGAARLFSEHGIRGGTLADVARSVGLVTNSLTYYYRRKEDLASACLMRAIDALQEAAVQAATHATLSRRVHGFVERVLGQLAEIELGRQPALIVLSDVRAIGPPHEAALYEAYNGMFRAVRSLLQAADAPPLERDALNARAHLLLSSTNWSRVWLDRYEPADYVAVAARIADLLLDGLVRPGGALPAPGPALPPIGVTGDLDRSAEYLRAATRLVNRHGYHGASVDRIATELGLTKGSFYHHHETKEELIAACFERTFDAMRRAQSLAASAGANGLDRLALACDALLRYQMSSDGPLLRTTAWSGLPQALRRDTERTMNRLGDRFATPILEGMADGSARVVDAQIAAQLFSGMINAAIEIDRWVRGAHADNVFELFAMPLFAGLRASPSRLPRREPPSVAGGSADAPRPAAAAPRAAAVPDSVTTRP